MQHAIFFNGSAKPIVIQPTSHTYRPARGESSWRILEVPDGFVASGYKEDLQQYRTVEFYNAPYPAPRPKVQTKWAGSWAQVEQAIREGRTTR